MNPRQSTRTILPIHAGRSTFAVVVARFNGDVTENLKNSALACLALHGVDAAHVILVECPGAFELPQVADHLAITRKPDAIICLGAVIRGETPHFDFVASESARGIQQVALTHHLPVVFGVLTTDTRRQAVERSGGRHGDKGWDAALTAIEMTDTLRKIKRRPR